MGAREVVVRGALTADGNLVLDEKPDLPPGRVQITLRSGDSAPTTHGTMEDVLREIWAELDARGYPGRSAEEIDADIRQMRDEWEEHDRELEQLRERLHSAEGTGSADKEQP